MKVTIQYLTCKRIEIEINEEDNIEVLADKIIEKESYTDINKNNIVLILGKSVLSLDKKLKDYNITEGSRINLILRTGVSEFTNQKIQEGLNSNNNSYSNNIRIGDFFANNNIDANNNNNTQYSQFNYNENTSYNNNNNSNINNSNRMDIDS